MAKKKTENALVALSEQLPVSATVPMGVLAEFTTSTSYLPRLQLFTKGKYIDQGKITPGHYGTVENDSVVDLGTELEVLVLAVRPKSLDMVDKDNIKSRYEPGEEEFERIRAQSGVKDSHCQCGLSFLMYESSTNLLYEFFCGSKSAQSESKKILTFMAISPEQAAAAAEAGNIIEPQPMSPMTLSVKYIQKAFNWHAPVAGPCSTPVDVLIPAEKLVAAVEKFVNPQPEGGTVVEAPAAGGRAV